MTIVRRPSSDPLTAWLESRAAPRTVTLGAALRVMGPTGFGRVLLMLTLPNVLLIPSLPPLPLIAGIPAVIVAAQMMAGRPHASLPGCAERLSAERGKALRLARWAVRLGALARPGRWNWMAGRVANCLLGVTVIAMTALICLPLPGINFFPAAGLVVLCVGLAEGDGVVAAVGVALSLLGAAVMALAVYGAALAAARGFVIPGIPGFSGFLR
jgi:hypothetical protein